MKGGNERYFSLYFFFKEEKEKLPAFVIVATEPCAKGSLKRAIEPQHSHFYMISYWQAKRILTEYEIDNFCQGTRIEIES